MDTWMLQDVKNLYHSIFYSIVNVLISIFVLCVCSFHVCVQINWKPIELQQQWQFYSISISFHVCHLLPIQSFSKRHVAYTIQQHNFQHKKWQKKKSYFSASYSSDICDCDSRFRQSVMRWRKYLLNDNVQLT